MLELTRTYKNVSSEVLRVDTIIMEKTHHNTWRPFRVHPDQRGITYSRNFSTVNHYGPAVRAVSSIEVAGNFDIIESSSGDYTYCEWYSPVAACDMSDLPAVSDDV